MKKMLFAILAICNVCCQNTVKEENVIVSDGYWSAVIIKAESDTIIFENKLNKTKIKIDSNQIHLNSLDSLSANCFTVVSLRYEKKNDTIILEENELVQEKGIMKKDTIILKQKGKEITAYYCFIDDIFPPAGWPKEKCK